METVFTHLDHEWAAIVPSRSVGRRSRRRSCAAIQLRLSGGPDDVRWDRVDPCGLLACCGSIR